MFHWKVALSRRATESCWLQFSHEFTKWYYRPYSTCESCTKLTVIWFKGHMRVAFPLWTLIESEQLTLTLLSSGRGSGASRAPISTRQVEGRRPSEPEPPPPLPPDISESPLSVDTQWCHRPRRRTTARPVERPARRDAFTIYLAGRARTSQRHRAASTHRRRCHRRHCRHCRHPASAPWTETRDAHEYVRYKTSHLQPTPPGGATDLHATDATCGYLPRVPPQRLQLAGSLRFVPLHPVLTVATVPHQWNTATRHTALKVRDRVQSSSFIVIAS